MSFLNVALQRFSGYGAAEADSFHFVVSVLNVMWLSVSIPRDATVKSAVCNFVAFLGHAHLF